MDFITILKEDHEKIKAVMAELEVAADNKSKNCDELFQRFKKLFDQHDDAEDEVVYPALKKFDELKKLANKGFQAHHIVEVAILELKLSPYASENWAPKFSVLKDSILSHIKEEEEVLFPKAIQLLTAEENAKLAKQIMESRKEQVYS